MQAHTMTHLLRRFVPALATLCAALLGTGCATYSQKASGNIDLVRSGQVDAALLQLEGEKSGRNRQLGLVESARLKLLAGRLDESRQEFTQAIDASMERAEGAVIKVREVGGTLLASTITDDTTRPYVLPGYEGGHGPAAEGAERPLPGATRNPPQSNSVAPSSRRTSSPSRMPARSRRPSRRRNPNRRPPWARCARASPRWPRPWAA
jgi:hypothetical protein